MQEEIEEINKIHLKYVDDFLIADSINLSNQSVTVQPQDRDLPDQFHA